MAATAGWLEASAGIAASASRRRLCPSKSAAQLRFPPWRGQPDSLRPASTDRGPRLRSARRHRPAGRWREPRRQPAPARSPRAEARRTPKPAEPRLQPAPARSPRAEARRTPKLAEPRPQPAPARSPPAEARRTPKPAEPRRSRRKSKRPARHRHGASARPEGGSPDLRRRSRPALPAPQSGTESGA